MPPWKRPPDKLVHPQTPRATDPYGVNGVPLWLQQIKQLSHAEQEHVLCDWLTRLQHAAPAAYLATLTRIESLALCEVQRRALDTPRQVR